MTLSKQKPLLNLMAANYLKYLFFMVSVVGSNKDKQKNIYIISNYSLLFAWGHDAPYGNKGRSEIYCCPGKKQRSKLHNEGKHSDKPVSKVQTLGHFKFWVLKLLLPTCFLAKYDR